MTVDSVRLRRLERSSKLRSRNLNSMNRKLQNDNSNATRATETETLSTTVTPSALTTETSQFPSPLSSPEISQLFLSFQYDTCPIGHFGVACSSCEASFYWSGSYCKKCSTLWWLFPVTVMFFLTGTCILGCGCRRMGNRSSRNSENTNFKSSSSKPRLQPNSLSLFSPDPFQGLPP